MNTLEPKVISTAKEILHDTEILSNSKEYKRYVVEHLVQKRDQLLDELVNDEAPVSHENFLIKRSQYKVYAELINRTDKDHGIALRMISEFNSKNQPH